MRAKQRPQKSVEIRGKEKDERSVILDSLFPRCIFLIAVTRFLFSLVLSAGVLISGPVSFFGACFPSALYHSYSLYMFNDLRGAVSGRRFPVE